MTKNWKTLTLGDVLTKSEKTLEISPTDSYQQITVRLWGNGVVSRGIIIGSNLGSSRWYKARSGQFILSRIDARHGAFGLVPPNLEGAIVSSDFPLFNVTLSLLQPEYLYWLSRTNLFIELCKRASEGTTNRVRLKLDQFLATEISLPPLEEQRLIVAHIDALAERIAEARGLRQDMMEEIEKFLESMTESIFLTAANDFPLEKLVNLSRSIGGGTPSKHNPNFWKGEIPWISPKDMKTEEIFDSEDKISEEAVSESSTKIVPINSVLVVVRSGILRRTIPVAINRVVVTLNQDLRAIVPENRIIAEYVKWWIKGNRYNLLQKVKAGTTVQSLMWEEVANSPLPAPPLEEQRRIVTYLDDLQAQIDKLKHLQAEATAELDALLPSMLDRAFKGELTIEAPITLSEAFGLTENQLVLMRILEAVNTMKRKVALPVSITELMKYTFLVQEESDVLLRHKYNFVPDNFGPSCKEIYDDLNVLVKTRLLKERRLKGKRWISLIPNKKIASEASQRLTKQAVDTIDSLIAKYRKLNLNELLLYVYAKYPSYTVKSKRQDIVRRAAKIKVKN